MGKIAFEHKFEYLQTVYHKTDKEGDPCIILDIIYKGKANIILYLLSRGFNDEVWAQEEELTDKKPVF